MRDRYIKISKEYAPADVYGKYKALPRTITAKESYGEDIIFVDERDTDSFWIAGLSKEDFESRGYDTSKLTDYNMEFMAQRIRDNFIENLYWVEIDYFADKFKLPRKK